VRTALNGEYGFTAAMAGSIERLDTAQLRMVPSVSRWLGAFALWGGLGAILLVATAYRRAEPTVVGTHGRFLRAMSGHAWLIASVLALSVAIGVVAARVMKPEYEAKTTIWSKSEASRIAVAVRETRNVDDAMILMNQARMLDTVVRQLALYVRPDNTADTSLLKGFSIAERFVPGDYRLAVDDRGTRWQLSVMESIMTESGAAGDSIGRSMGLRWQPDPAILARYAGKEVRFTVATPNDATAGLRSRMTVLQQANSNFLQLALTDPDPQRAARTLNALAAVYVSKVRSRKGAALSVLDAAVAPPAPFKNSPAQLFAVTLVIGIASAIGLAFAASVLEERVRH
jgi:capsular polysaccharide biosynthesis protein